MPKKLIALATAGLALTLLVSCSSGGSSDGGSSDGGSSGGSGTASSAPSATKTAAAAPAQTKEEACSILENELASFLKEQGSSSAPADPTARAALIDEFADRLESALPKVSNEQVHDAFVDFSGAAADYGTALRSSGAADSAESKDAQTKLESTLDQVSTVCPAKS
jgi:hypothetical protein